MKNNTAHIRNINSLETLRSSIQRFCEDSYNQLIVIELKIQRKISELKAIEFQFQRHLEYAQDELRYARNALLVCEESIYEDDDGNTVYPDCDYEKESVVEAKNKLLTVEQNYRYYKKEIKILENIYLDYQDKKVKHKAFIQYQKESAIDSLTQVIDGADDYRATVLQGEKRIENNTKQKEDIGTVSKVRIITNSDKRKDLSIIKENTVKGKGDVLLRMYNENDGGIVRTIYHDKSKMQIISELSIGQRNDSKYGRVLRISVPDTLRQQKIGKHIIQNMEANCRVNGCKEINAWSNKENVHFYVSMGYKIRSDINGVGCEVYKPLENIYNIKQQNAKKAFYGINNADFIKAKKIYKQKVNPLDVISGVDVNDNKFWSQKGYDKNKYIELIRQYKECQERMEDGKTIDEIRRDDMWVANAYDVLHGSDSVMLLKVGEYYKVDSGRHRIAAAHLYYLQTGEIVEMPADILEKNEE